jgi:hypothetical protein
MFSRDLAGKVWAVSGSTTLFIIMGCWWARDDGPDLPMALFACVSASNTLFNSLRCIFTTYNCTGQEIFALRSIPDVAHTLCRQEAKTRVCKMQKLLEFGYGSIFVCI